MSDSADTPVEGTSTPVTDVNIDETPSEDSPASNQAVDEDGSPDVAVQALEEIELGRRSLALKDIREAAEHFSLACELLDTLYGPGSHECSEAYVLYGSTLLEVSRLDNGIVNDSKLPANEEDDEDDEEGEDGEEEQKTDEVPASEDASKDASKEESAKDTTEPATIPEEAGASAASSASTSAGPSTSAYDNPRPSTSKADPAEPEAEKEDMTDSELAWEILNMARLAYEKGEQSPDNIKLHAEALQKLGEISLEWENLDNAIDLFSRCLDMRKANDIHPRIVAQTYHFLALAHSSKKEFDKAVEFVKEAMTLLETFLRNNQQAHDDETDSDKKAALKAENEEVETLLPEMQLQLDEYKSQEVTGYQSLEVLESKFDEVERKAAGRSSDAGDKPVQDISHLVKRKTLPATENGNSNGENGQTNGNSEIKRKIDDVDENSDPKEAVKKVCADEVAPKSIEEPDAEMVAVAEPKIDETV